MKAPEIFVSYASRDRERVRAVTARLRECGASVWVDEHRVDEGDASGIVGGAIYGAEIVRGIREARVFLLLCSRASLSSPNVKQEIQLAWRYKRDYLPLLLEPIDAFPEDLAYQLEGRQWIQLFERAEPQWVPEVTSALQRAGVTLARPGAERSPAAGKPAGRTDRFLLPYLVNRSTELEALHAGIEEHVQAGGGKPLLFLVHGEERQCVDAFLERTHRVDLPKTLRRLGLSDVLRWHDGVWPTHQGGLDARWRLLNRAVTNHLDLRAASTPAEVRDALVRLRAPTVFSFHLGAEHWQPDDDRLLEEWGRQWAAFPPLPAAQPLILLFSTKYPNRSQGFLTSFLTGRRANQVRRVLASFEGRLRGAMPAQLLPELTSVMRPDVELWVRDVVRPDDPIRLMRDVRKLYEDGSLAPDDRIAMEPLAERLARLLSSVETAR